MNLQPIPIDEIPLGVPLSWRIYDRNGYIVFASGETVSSREQLVNLFSAGLMRDADAPSQPQASNSWPEFKEAPPIDGFPPAGIKPHAGERIQIRLLDQGSQNYFAAHLIGYIRNKSVLVTRPVASGSDFVPMEGRKVEVRMVTGNNIHAFQSTIQRLCNSPSLYMHLEYPTEVHVQKLRKSPWAKMNLAVTILDTQGGREAGSIVNLSSDGAQLHAPSSIGNPGGNIRLSFHATMDELKTTLNLDATILHMHPQAAGEAQSHMLEYGIAFHTVAFADALWLKALVYRHIAEGDLA